MIHELRELAKEMLTHWPYVVLVSQFAVIIVLLYLLVKKERVLQLLSMTLSPVGWRLSFELNKDEKLRLLSEEVAGLQQTVKALESKLRSQSLWGSLLVLGLTAIILFLALGPKLNAALKAVWQSMKVSKGTSTESDSPVDGAATDIENSNK